MNRCTWAGSQPWMTAYHDQEWGVPLHDEHALFEFLILEGAQAGLSWDTILRKRENYRRAFDNFDPAIVATYGGKKVAALLADEGIVRNRLKIKSAISNAAAFLRIQESFGSFDSYLWHFVDGKPIVNSVRSLADLPATSPQSDALSNDLRRRGFSFIGSTICYAFMQATGMVNDHFVDCFRYQEVQRSK